MKKILATVLALTMIVGMSIVPTFAAAVNTGAQTINVTANYDKAESVVSSRVVYSIDLSYDSMVFNFTETGNELVWNPNTLAFDNEQEVDGGSWDKTTATITIKNKSNAALNVTAVATDGFDVTEAVTVPSAVVTGGTNAEQTKTLTVTVPDTISEDVAATVTVTIA